MRSARARRNAACGRVVAVIAVVLAGFVAGALSRPQSVGASQMCPPATPEENASIVERWYQEVWNQGNVAIIAELLSDEVVRHEGNRSDTESDGVAAVEAIVREQRFVDFPDLTVTIQDLIAERNLVVARLTWAGTHSDDLEEYAGFDTAPTFQQVSFGGTSAFRIDCGKIVEQWVSADILGLLQQIGAAPPPAVPYPLVSIEAPAESPSCPPGSPADNLAAVERLYAEILNGHDLGAVAEVHSTDAAFHGGEGAPLVGLLAHTAHYAGWLQGHPDLRITLEATVAQGDRVAVRWTATGTQVASYTAAGVVPPNGRVVTFAGITIYRVACDRIAESWEHFDNLDLYRQVIEEMGGTPAAD